MILEEAMGKSIPVVKLSAGSRRVMDSLADAMIPSGEPGRPGALDLNLVDNLMAWMDSLPIAGAARGLTLVCWVWEFSPIWSGRLARFSSLSLEDRMSVLESWEHSRLAPRRLALFGLKALLMVAFYNNPETWPHIGYQEGCLSEPPNAIKSRS